MNDETVKSARFSKALLLAALLGFAWGCNDEGPTAPGDGTTTTTTPPPSGTGRVRTAQLTVDARTVDVAIDGDVLFPALAFPSVSDYVELDEGRHRVQFFPAGSTRTALREAFVDVVAGEAVTVAIVTPELRILTFSDDLSVASEQARLKLVNVVEDFPASFDLMVVNGPRLIRDVAFGASSSYEPTVPGVYAFSLLRGGTNEEVAVVTGATLPSGSASTVFAVGSLGRQDIQLYVARDR